MNTPAEMELETLIVEEIWRYSEADFDFLMTLRAHCRKLEALDSNQTIFQKYRKEDILEVNALIFLAYNTLTKVFFEKHYTQIEPFLTQAEKEALNNGEISIEDFYTLKCDGVYTFFSFNEKNIQKIFTESEYFFDY